MKNINFENVRKNNKAYNRAFERRRLEFIRHYCPDCKYKTEDDCKVENLLDCPMLKFALGKI